jgi:flagellar biosynthesis protein FlhB
VSWTNDEGKTEKPTPRRREKARKEGSVAKSMELNAAAVLTTASLMMIWFGSGIVLNLRHTMTTLLREMGTMEISPNSLPVYMWHGMQVMAVLLGPVFLGIMVMGIAVNVGQVGFHITPKAAAPKFSRLNPLKGFQRLFSMQSLVELGKSLLKLVLIGGIVYLAISTQFDRIYSLMEVPFEALTGEVGRLLTRIFLLASLSLIIIGILDYAYNRYEYEKSLKMTKEEVKEEAKQSEGDPKVKSKIREIMFRSSFRRMMKKLPEADVVITNPVHVAVALKYDRKRSAAPIVVAKGMRKVAERIKEIAREHDIPIIENPPLARTLFSLVEIGHEIPAELYKAVAEVLAYVYRMKRKFFGVA